MPPNIVLVGFMGSGKSTIGRHVARQLGWRFVDTDLVIEKVAGVTIPELFAAEGEPRFRDRETTVILGRCAGEQQVIATGGGAILREENRLALQSAGMVVWLTTRADIVAERVGRLPGRRPLLEQEEPPETVILRLLAQRAPLYQAAADRVVDTSDRSPTALAQEIVRLAEEWVNDR